MQPMNIGRLWLLHRYTLYITTEGRHAGTANKLTTFDSELGCIEGGYWCLPLFTVTQMGGGGKKRYMCVWGLWGEGGGLSNDLTLPQHTPQLVQVARKHVGTWPLTSRNGPKWFRSTFKPSQNQSVKTHNQEWNLCMRVLPNQNVHSQVPMLPSSSSSKQGWDCCDWAYRFISEIDCTRKLNFIYVLEC